jgi:hypothetical protein
MVMMDNSLVHSVRHRKKKKVSTTHRLPKQALELPGLLRQVEGLQNLKLHGLEG